MSGIITLPKTGVVACYDGGGSLVPCAGTGQDAETQIGQEWPLTRFTGNGDGTVTDSLTGLIWLEDASAVPAGNWNSALAAADTAEDGVYGLSDGSVPGDWRLPNINEMNSIVALAFFNPSVTNGEGTDRHGDSGTVVFSGIVNGKYWSSTTYISAKTRAWNVSLDNSNVQSGLKSSSAGTWLIKDGQSGFVEIPKTGLTTCYDSSGVLISCGGSGQDADLLKGVSLPEPRFIDNLDGTVIDLLTGLTWTKDGSVGNPVTWANSFQTAAAAADGVYGLSDGSSPGDWRVPNARELVSLINYNYSSDALSDAAGAGPHSASPVFQGVSGGFPTWSSDTYSGSTQFALTFRANYGDVGNLSKVSGGIVWLVKGGIPPEFFWTTHKKQFEPLPQQLHKSAQRKIIPGDPSKPYIPPVPDVEAHTVVTQHQERVCKRVGT